MLGRTHFPCNRRGTCIHGHISEGKQLRLFVRTDNATTAALLDHLNCSVLVAQHDSSRIHSQDLVPLVYIHCEQISIRASCIGMESTNSQLEASTSGCPRWQSSLQVESLRKTRVGSSVDIPRQGRPKSQQPSRPPA